jgi:hypothetical protein
VKRNKRGRWEDERPRVDRCFHSDPVVVAFYFVIWERNTRQERR